MIFSRLDAREAFFKRLSCTNLANAGLPELAVLDRESYVQKAVAIASDEAWRHELRRTMRLRPTIRLATARASRFEHAILAWMEERPA